MIYFLGILYKLSEIQLIQLKILIKMKQGLILNIIRSLEFNWGEVFGTNRTGVIQLGTFSVSKIIIKKIWLLNHGCIINNRIEFMDFNYPC